jgi:hypothetical protein
VFDVWSVFEVEGFVGIWLMGVMGDGCEGRKCAARGSAVGRWQIPVGHLATNWRTGRPAEQLNLNHHFSTSVVMNRLKNQEAGIEKQ